MSRNGRGSEICLMNAMIRKRGIKVSEFIDDRDIERKSEVHGKGQGGARSYSPSV